MLGSSGDAVTTPSSTRCHMDGLCPRTHQRSRCRSQRGARGDHVVHEEDPASASARAAFKTRACQSHFAAGARLRCRTNTPKQLRRTHSQSPSRAAGQCLGLVEATRAAMCCSRRRPSDHVNRCGVDSGGVKRRRVKRRRVKRRRVNRCGVNRGGVNRCGGVTRSKMCQRQRVAQPAGDGPLAPVLERMHKLAPDIVVGEQQRDRLRTRNPRWLRIGERCDAPGAGTPPECLAPRTPHLEQHPLDHTAADIAHQEN